MTIGEKLQYLRKKNKLSQEEVAEQVSVSRQAVSKWENDLSYPDTKNLIRLSEVFNISMQELINSSYNSEENLQDENKEQNEKNIKNKIYYHNETVTKLISYIVLVVFIPLNIYFYNKGIYGEKFIELGFLSKAFLKDSLIYDIPFIIIIFGWLYKAVKDIKNIKDVDKSSVIISNKDKFIRYIAFTIVSLIIITIYFKIEEFTSIAAFLGMFTLVYISIFEVVREITKKELV